MLLGSLLSYLCVFLNYHFVIGITHIVAQCIHTDVLHKLIGLQVGHFK